MNQPLQSARLKIDRAGEHLDTLKECVKRFHDTDPYRVTRELEREGAEHVYYLQILREPPPYLGTVIGDVLHNLRSALDSVVYDLSVSAHPELSERERRSVGFPIAQNSQDLDRTKIRFVTPAAQAEIETAQPYTRSKSASLRERDPLSLLNRLNAIDKHRQVLVVPALSVGSSHTGSYHLAIKEIRHPIGPLQNGAELTRFIFTEPHPEMDVDFQPVFDVALGESSQTAVWQLRAVRNYIGKMLLPRFEPFVG